MESMESDNPGKVATDIAADGDVIMVVGPTKAILRVHSLMLKMASRVFTAMLGPHFSEGQDLAADRPKEISLPEDNVQAMGVICKLLHSRPDLTCKVALLKPEEVFQIAVLADKYDCMQLFSTSPHA